MASKLTDLASVTPRTATKWGKVFAVDQYDLVRALTAAQAATAT
jgi:hypothetical protein